jgi:hypothetical protein
VIADLDIVIFGARCAAQVVLGVRGPSTGARARAIAPGPLAGIVTCGGGGGIRIACGAGRTTGPPSPGHAGGCIRRHAIEDASRGVLGQYR